MSELADYDRYDYHYEKYWEKRKYEHEAELLTLRKLFKNVQGKRIIDIGGSYGRLTLSYVESFEEVVILDYSLKTLQRNQEKIRNTTSKALLVAANAYKPPFKEGSFDGEIMVRVLHHITDQKDLFNTLYRLLSPNGVSIVEVPNKIHIKNRLKALSKKNKSVFSMQPEQQESQGANEGSSGEYVPFLNYHPRFIEEILHETKFQIDQKKGCSYFRSTPIARSFPLSVTLALEGISQTLFSSFDITPSIFYKNSKSSDQKLDNPNSNLYKPIHEIFSCPECNKDLPSIKGKDEVLCTFCNSIYKFSDGVWDFRVT